jgi:hypothetical protein
MMDYTGMPKVFAYDRDPNQDDIFYPNDQDKMFEVGSLWINEKNYTCFVFTGRIRNKAKWISLSIPPENKLIEEDNE